MPKGSPKSATERSRAMRERLDEQGMRRVSLTIPTVDEAWFRAEAARRSAMLKAEHAAWREGDLERVELYVTPVEVEALRVLLEQAKLRRRRPPMSAVGRWTGGAGTECGVSGETDCPGVTDTERNG